MPTVWSFEGIVPVVDPTSYLHPSAVLIGDVVIGPGCYIGPGASLRGDFGRIVLGAGANVQDNCVLHTFPGRITLIEEDGHIGHGAILHSCAIRKGALIGMGAVVNDNAVIGEYAMVAALAFVKAGTEIAPRTLAAGVPARPLRSLSDQEVAWKAEGTRHYQQLARRCLASLRPVEDLTAPEPGRAVGPADPSLDPLHLHKAKREG